jgi:post-segregation antitoxin (ccd killing protein)
LKKSLVFIILFSFGAFGCAGISKSPVAPSAVRPAECAAFFENLDKRVEAAGVRNAAAAAVPGFPYLRANRFLAALGLRLKGEDEKDSWGRWMQELDLQGRKAEISNLPEEAVQTLAGEKDAARAREAVFSRLASCADEFRRHDRAGKDYFAAVQANVHVPDEYSMFLRVVGIHPLTAVPVAMATENSRARFQKWFEGDLARLPVEGKLKTYFPREGSPGDPEQIARIVSGAVEPFLKAPRPGPAELEKLARAFAPVIVQDTAQPFDALGRPAWRGDRVEILPDPPALYYYFSHAFLNGKPILQIQYVAWYGARGGKKPPWFERGHLDGLTLRFSLDSQGRLFMVDGMNNCGCYHFFAPDRGRVNQVLAPSSATPPFVPQDLPKLGPGERLGLRVNSGWHQVQRLLVFREAAAPVFYDLLPYEVLESLPTENGPGKSLFNSEGIVPGTERNERIFLFPMGVPSVGSMRQRGHQAIDFIGKAHFDDPDLFERNFVLQ